MPQFSITTTTTTTTTITTTMATSTHHFPSLLFSYLILFCSFIFSHPLYISYFIFFSPYLLKLFSFLSPLFITTSLFLLVFFLAYHNNSCSQNQESKVEILLNSYQKILNALGWSLDEENDQNFQLLEGLEACMVVVDDATQNYLLSVGFKDIALSAEEKTGEFKETTLNQEEKTEDFIVSLNVEEKAGKMKDVALFIEEQVDEFQDVADIIEENTEEFQELSLNLPKETGEFSQNNSQALHEISHSATTPEMTSKPQLELIPLTNKQMNNYKENQSTQQPPPPLKNLEEMLCSAITPSVSMRKEKEWKRTLACKLYEERQNREGSEGMDLLWEEYEVDTGKVKKKDLEQETEYDGEDEEEEVDVKLCCLQALKMSTGKMNLGMKKPNLVKFSKALKGIGWLHHVSSRNGSDRVTSI